MTGLPNGLISPVTDQPPPTASETSRLLLSVLDWITDGRPLRWNLPLLSPTRCEGPKQVLLWGETLTFLRSPTTAAHCSALLVSGRRERILTEYHRLHVLRWLLFCSYSLRYEKCYAWVAFQMLHISFEKIYTEMMPRWVTFVWTSMILCLCDVIQEIRSQHPNKNVHLGHFTKEKTLDYKTI